MDQRGGRQLGISHFKVPLFGQETPLNDSFWQQGFVKESFDLELKFWFLMVAESIGVRITFKGKGMWSVVFRIETSPLHFQVHIRLQQRQNGPRTFFLFGRKTSHKPLVFFFLDMVVSKKSGIPEIIHFNRVFHYKPYILGYRYFWKHPYWSFFTGKQRRVVIKFILPWLPIIGDRAFSYIYIA